MSRTRQPWTAEELARLRREAILRPTPELAAEMGRTANAIKRKCLAMGIACKQGQLGRRRKAA